MRLTPAQGRRLKALCRLAAESFARHERELRRAMVIFNEGEITWELLCLWKQYRRTRSVAREAGRDESMVRYFLKPTRVRWLMRTMGRMQRKFG